MKFQGHGLGIQALVPRCLRRGAPRSLPGLLVEQTFQSTRGCSLGARCFPCFRARACERLGALGGRLGRLGSAWERLGRPGGPW